MSLLRHVIYPSKVGSEMTVSDAQIFVCLLRSHALLQHYAKLLNQYDGGNREVSPLLEEWISRTTEQEPREGPGSKPADEQSPGE